MLGIIAYLPAAQAEDVVQYRIEKVKANVYRFIAGHYRSVFMVTKDGILVTDPVNRAAAHWLSRELKQRFDVPVRYLVYSHSHPDHAYGGESFIAPGMRFVAQRLAREQMQRSKLPVPAIDLSFNDEMHIHLGDSEVHLRYHGANNGRGSISMHFQPANVLYIVDWVVVGRLPYQKFQGYDIEGVMDTTRDILQLDFDVFVGGHAEVGSKADVQRYYRYMQTLYHAVRDGMLQGQSLAHMQNSILLSEYRDLAMYEQWRTQNIEGMYRHLLDNAYFHLRPEVPALNTE